MMMMEFNSRGGIVNFDGKKMREIRKSKGMRIDDLYHVCLIKWCRFQRYESGKGFPSETDARKIATALGVTVDTLLRPIPESEGL